MATSKTTDMTKAISLLKLPAQGAQVNYTQLAQGLNFTPRKIVKGKETKALLKEGSPKYREAVYTELMRQYREKLPIVKKDAVVNVPPRQIKKVLVDSLLSKKIEKFSFEYEGINNLEDYYNAIRKEYEALGGATYVVIPFRSKFDNKIIARSIDTGDLFSYEQFADMLEQIVTGTNKQGEVGSDPISRDEYEPDYNHFIITVSNINPNAFGKSDKMLYKVKGIESERGECVYESLKECGINCYDYGFTPFELSDMKKLIELIKYCGEDIAIVANGFTINKTPLEIINANGKTMLSIFDKAKKRNRQYEAGRITLDDINVVYIYGNQYSKHFIIYDSESQHADYAKTLDLDENVMLTSSSSVIKNGVVVFTAGRMNKVTNNLSPTPLYYLFFDYETVIDFNTSSCMQPYSLSILMLTPSQLNDLEIYDGMKRQEDVNRIRTANCITFMGYDCNEQFISWFLENQLNKMFVMIGFNNTNFDNFLLLEGLLKYKELHPETEYSVSDIFYNGSQLLNFRVAGRHTTFDIRKHLVGTLRKNCESFKINCCSKKEFDHDYAQSLHNNQQLINYITNNEELREYNEYDVLATAVLYRRYQLALGEIQSTSKYSNELYQHKTIGSLIYKVFCDNKKEKNFELPMLDYQFYKDLQKSKIAGRVEMFNGVQKVEERLASTDVCSLYPYVMAVHNCYYPCGDEIVMVNDYLGDDEIGFYYCDIDQSCLKDKNLPNIYAKKSETENDWSYDGVLENYLISNVMIGLLRENGCNVVVKEGFVFQNKMKSCEMFGFLLEMMKAKNFQDLESKKEKKCEANSYNPALRETLKLLMNSLSGKVIEGLHTEKTVDINNCADYLKIQEKASKINFINAVGGKVFLTYELNEEELINQQRPIYLGVLIYDYAKRYMYRNSYSKIGKANLLYTDTDASKFRYRHFLEWKNWVETENVVVPHWEEVEAYDERYKGHLIYRSDSKVFGSFEDELEDYIGDEYVFYCLEKKSWLYGYKNGSWKSKYRFKGLNDGAQLLTLDEPFIERKLLHHKAKGDEDAWDEVKYVIKPESELEVYNYYVANKHNNLGNGNAMKFFDKVYSTGTAYVMCNSFRKIVKNSARNVGIDDVEDYNELMNKIQVNYNIKKIQIKSIANVYEENLNDEDDEDA